MSAQMPPPLPPARRVKPPKSSEAFKALASDHGPEMEERLAAHAKAQAEKEAKEKAKIDRLNDALAKTIRFILENPSQLEANTSKISSLVKNGANINAELFEGETPLMVAIKSGPPQLVEILLKNRATINFSENPKITPDAYFFEAKSRNDPSITPLVRKALEEFNEREDLKDAKEKVMEEVMAYRGALQAEIEKRSSNKLEALKDPILKQLKKLLANTVPEVRTLIQAKT